MTRLHESITFYTILENMFSNNNNNIFNTFYTSLSEFGITFHTYTEAVSFYPDVLPFKYGITYLLGPLTLIPGIGQIVPLITETLSVPSKIEKIIGYSVGGSFGEELYGNFGLLAIPISVICGYLFVKLLRKNINGFYLGYDGAKYYIWFYFLINLVRATFNEILRSSIWTFAILSIILKVIKNKEKIDNYNGD